MIVTKEDIEAGKDPLPVRAGCGNGPCACMGTCKDIVGYISRKEYVDFLSKYVSKKTFIKQNYQPVTPKRSLSAIELTMPSDRIARYKVMAALRNDVFEVGTPLHVISKFMDYPHVQPGSNMFQLLQNNETLRTVLESVGVKINLRYEEGYER